MVEIIKRDKDRGVIDGLVNPNTGRPYNSEVAQDRTGMLLNARPRGEAQVKGDPRYDIRVLAKNPTKLECVNCGKDEFFIFLDSHPQGMGAAQFRCKNSRCKTVSPVFQLKVPDMNDFRARQMGLMIPSGATFKEGPRYVEDLGAIVMDIED